MTPGRIKQPPSFNYPLGIFLVALLLIACGVVMVYASSAAMAGVKVREPKANAGEVDGSHLATSLSASFLKKQIRWALMGLAVMAGFFCLKYGRLRDLAPWLLVAAAVLLAVVLKCHPIKGSCRWISIGSFSIQPSELAKLAMALYMARFISNRADKTHSFTRCWLPAILVLAPILALIVVEPDFGAMAVLGAIVFSIWFVSDMRLLHQGMLIASALPPFIAVMLAEPYRVQRWLAFLHPERNLRGAGWHVYQSLVTLGSGGVAGVGLGQSVQKFNFLTEAHTDFILSIVGEETGLIGLTVLMVAYVALIVMGLRVAYQTPDFFGMLVAYGMTAMIAIPAIINFGVVTSCLPPKGLALPFISYGGSSMLVNCAAIGILMNIASANYAQRKKAA